MPITIELTPDQVQSILAQLMPPNGHKPDVQLSLPSERTRHGEGLAKAKSYIDALPAGSVVNIRGVAAELDVSTKAVSTVIATLKGLRQVEMVVRGTWRKR